MRPALLLIGLVLNACQPFVKSSQWQDNTCPQLARCPQIPCETPSESTPRVLLKAGTPNEFALHVLVAATPEAIGCGLMHVSGMAADWGMLFVFSSEKPRSFWMYDTMIALDLIFADQNGQIVALAENAKPMDATLRYESGLPARYVLEVNAGLCARNGIQVGQRIALVGVPGAHQAEILR